MSSDSESNNSYQQTYTQTNQTSNIKVLDKNIPDSEFELKSEKKLNQIVTI